MDKIIRSRRRISQNLQEANMHIIKMEALLTRIYQHRFEGSQEEVEQDIEQMKEQIFELLEGKA